MNSFLLVTKLPTRFYTWMAWIPTSLKKLIDEFKALILNSPVLIGTSIIQGKILRGYWNCKAWIPTGLEKVRQSESLTNLQKYEGSQAIKGPTAHGQPSYQDSNVLSPKGCHIVTKQTILCPRHAAPPNRLKEGISTLGNNLLTGIPQTLSKTLQKYPFIVLLPT